MKGARFIILAGCALAFSLSARAQNAAQSPVMPLLPSASQAQAPYEAQTPQTATGIGVALPPGAPQPAPAPALAAGAPPAPAAPAAPDAALDPMQDAQMRVGLQQAYQLTARLRQPDVNPQQFGSLFFTPWQHALLQEAKRGFLARPPTQGEIDASEDAAISGSRPQSIREISLGGIIFRRTKDWTIYLNGQRVTPDAIPNQVIDLKVADDHIDLKWFDTFTNLIFPIRLRAHQRFNLDARMFLPGTATQ